jgi:hypothetical protein
MCREEKKRVVHLLDTAIHISLLDPDEGMFGGYGGYKVTVLSKVLVLKEIDR